VGTPTSRASEPPWPQGTAWDRDSTWFGAAGATAGPSAGAFAHLAGGVPAGTESVYIGPPHDGSADGGPRHGGPGHGGRGDVGPAGAGREQRRRSWPGRLARLAGAGAAGGLLVIAFPPYDLWPLAAVAVGLLDLVTHRRPVREGLLLGLVTGLAFFVPLLHWSSIYVGAAPWLLLATSQAAFLAALGGALALVHRLPGWPLWSAALWVVEEALRSRGPYGGFPWGRLGFSQADSPAARLAEYGGAPLVTFAVALSGALLAALVLAPGRGRPARLLAPAAGLLAVGAVVAGAAVATPGSTGAGGVAGEVTLAVVQGNVPRLGLDFNEQRRAVLDNHVRRTLELAAEVRSGAQPRPELVIWPENSSDIDPLTNADARAEIDRAARAIGVPILVGAILDGPGSDHVRNAGVVWSPTTGPGEMYIKRHPVPFGEYIPLRSIARRVSAEVDRVRRDMVAGSEPGVLRVGGVTLGDVICFEVAYDGLVRDAVRGGGRLLVVQTNNATFGRSNETWQQLAMGRLRAIEHGRSVVIAATSGVSAIIEPDGHVLRRSDVFTADLLVRAVPTRQGTTLATRVGAWAEWTIVAVGAAALLVAAAVGVRRRRGEREGRA
jgi:apolipoprotein N-acyltransferase